MCNTLREGWPPFHVWQRRRGIGKPVVFMDYDIFFSGLKKAVQANYINLEKIARACFGGS